MPEPHQQWNAAKKRAKKAGMDVSDFKDAFSKKIDQINESLLKFDSARGALLKEVIQLRKVAKKYYEACENLSNSHSDDKAKKVIAEELSSAAIAIESECQLCQLHLERAEVNGRVYIL
jgi:flagellar hook-basal body complex protein FliE